jgi:hypothetical protein
MMLGSSPLPPESEDSKALNIQYPKAINNDAVVLSGPDDRDQTWVKFGGRWNVFERGMDELYSPKRIIADLTRSFSYPTNLDPITGLPVVDFPTGGISAGNLALIGLLGFLLLRGAIK